MNDLAIRTWNICIGGFLQTEGRPTGIVDLWAKMRAQNESPHCRVELRSWCQKWSDLAELVWRYRPESYSPVVNVFAYSWGGFSARLFALELKRRGLSIQTLVTCDAVYRHSYWLGQWRAFAPWSEIVIPSNVAEVWWFRQKNPRIQFGRSGGVLQPAGHEIVAESVEHTFIHKPTIIGCEHMYADDDPKFREKALKVAYGSFPSSDRSES